MHGVRLASIRLGWAWLLRPTAHGVSLASTNLEQVETRERVGGEGREREREAERERQRERERERERKRERE